MAFSMAGPGVLAHGAAAQAPAGKITLKGHTIPALKNLTSTGNTSGLQALQLSIALNPRNSAQLQTLLTQLNDRSSANYHHYLTPAQFAQAFGRTPSEVGAVTSYLKSQGVHVTSVAPNNLLIDATSSVTAAEQAFGVTIANYTLNGRRVYAPTNDPSLPASIGSVVRAIGGLDNVGVYHPQNIVAGPVAHLKQHPNGGTGPGNFYGPSDLRNAYDMNTLVNSYSSSGLNIALFELDGYTVSDIQAYRSYFGLPSLSVSNILVDGATTAAGADALEVILDMEVASAIAPNANQNIYIGPNTTAGVNDTYTRIATDDTAKVVSTSWGLCEYYSGQSELTALDSIFQQYAAQGQALFAASGDYGAYGCMDGTTLSVDSPASDPNVVGVGGTTLQTGTNASYSSETAWSDTSTSPGTGSGGGLSAYFAQPSYQSGPGVSNSYSNGMREVPDVAADSDPNTGYDVYCSATNAGCLSTGAWYAVAGTSAAAPLWASIAVDTNQYLASQGQPTLGSASAMIYQIFNHPQPYSAYHDITSGGNLYYPTSTGYDLATGIGSPDVWNFARDAAALSPGRSIAKTWYFGEGYTGAGFSEFLTLANPNNAAASVQVSYLLDTGSPIVKTYSVAATSRYTVYVNNEVPAGHGVSMVVSANLPIVAERPMYFTYTSTSSVVIPGGTDVLGATTLGTQYDFGYLDTSNSPGAHDTFLTILNPQASSMSVTINYYPAAGGAPITRTHSVAANSRGTVFVGGEGLAAGQYGALVSLSVPGLVERPMYLVDGVTGYTGSADVVGVSAPLTSWYFAEGYTASTFSERYILFNPNASATSATLTFLKSDGTTVAVPVSLGAGAQQVVDANSVLGSGGVNNSATVTASAPIVAERFMSFSFPGTSSIPGATDVIGAAAPGNVAYFAEGYTGGQFSEFLTLENPDPSNTAYVYVTYLPSSGGAVVTRTLSVPPHSRYTLYTNNDMPNQSFSMVVQSSLPVVAERPMYFNFNNGQTGGTDVLGYQP